MAIINNYTKGVHMGIQPIRVLEQNIINIFENSHPDFEELRKIVTEMGLKPGITYQTNEFPIFNKDPNGNNDYQLPYVSGDKEITLHETFLSYIWIISYALYATYREYDPSVDTSQDDVLISSYVTNASSLLDYGLSLLEKYSSWNYDLPNPERFDANDLKLKEYIEQANGIFLYAVLFILYHEISHVELKHLEYGEEFYNKYGLEPPDDEEKRMEYEADTAAFELMNKSLQDGNKISVKLGCIIAICCLLILSKNYRSTTHPHSHERLYTALEQMNLKEDDPIWNIASMAIILWGVKYKVQLNFSLVSTTPKDLFVALYQQLEKL